MAAAAAARSPNPPQQQQPEPSSLLQPVPTNFGPSHSPFSPSTIEMNMTDNDDILSEILDGLIEFQEKSPIGRVVDSVVGSSFEPETQISSIEKYLASSTPDSLLFQQPKAAATPASSSTLSSLLSAPPISASPTIQQRPNNNFNLIGQVPMTGVTVQRTISTAMTTAVTAASIVPRMNELLGVVPPNVSVTDAPQDQMESMLSLQERRRRMSSGGGKPMMQLQQQQLQQRPPLRMQTSLQQPQRLSFGEVDSGFTPIVRHFTPTSKSPNVVMPSTSPTSYMPIGASITTSSYQTFSGGGVILHNQQQQQQQHQQQQQQQLISNSNPGYLRRASYPGPMAQQQQPMQSGVMHLSPNLIVTQQQHPAMSMNPGAAVQQQPPPHHRRASGNNGVDPNARMQPEEKRSLLQQLLSE